MTRRIFMSTRTGSVSIAFSIFLTAGLLWAHHAIAPNFDTSKVVTFNGAITKLDWKNPHIEIFFDAKNERGQTETWLLTGGQPADLVNRGVSRSDLEKAIGQPVTMALWRARDGTLWGNMLRLSLPDGKFFCVGEGGCENALPNRQFAWFDRTGKLIETVGKPGAYKGMDVSPDGKRIAVHRHEGNGGDIWILESGRTRRLTTDASGTQDNSSPIWSGDGSRIVFASYRNGKWGIYVKRADGASAEELLMESEISGEPMSWSPDGKFIVYCAYAVRDEPNIWVLPLTGERKPSQLVADLSCQGQISPDGKWIAYHTREPGQRVIYIKPFPTGSGKWRVSAVGNNGWPRWRGDGRELYFLEVPSDEWDFQKWSTAKVRAVDIRVAGTSVQAGTPRTLFEPVGSHLAGGGVYNHGGLFHMWAVSPDGQRFLIPRAETPAASR
jgi:hypothetical protein